MKIILIGFMGSGKSSVAQEISRVRNLPVVEMDDLVCRKTNSADMKEVFKKGGEQLLRETEAEVARSHLFAHDSIISTGGGVVLNKVILDHLKHPGDRIFFLNSSFQTIKNRLQHDSSRPLFQDIREAESLYHFRLPLYMQYADHIIDTDHKSVQDTALEILKQLKCNLN
jgi:shikimate kinase